MGSIRRSEDLTITGNEMKVAIAPKRVFHSAQLANALITLGHKVEIFSSAPRQYFRMLGSEPRLSFSPLPFAILEKIGVGTYGENSDFIDSVIYDAITSIRLKSFDLFIGWSTCCLISGRKSKSQNVPYVVDRACPHVEFQQELLRSEADKHGLAFTPQPRWFVERQLQEYEDADAILCPSRYSADTFPPRLRQKISIAPLLGRVSARPYQPRTSNEKFTVGVVGGAPLRKGYVYLLEAWKKLNLPNSILRIRSGALEQQEKLARLVSACGNVELVGYIPDINEFYKKCDVFVLPSVDDGFGMALLEAMAHGVPCVATTHCGASELVQNERDALIVPPFDAEAIAEAIWKFYSNKELRDEVGLAGYNLVACLSGDGSGGLYESNIGRLATELRNGRRAPDKVPLG